MGYVIFASVVLVLCIVCDIRCVLAVKDPDFIDADKPELYCLITILSITSITMVIVIAETIYKYIINNAI